MEDEGAARVPPEPTGEPPWKRTRKRLYHFIYLQPGCGWQGTAYTIFALVLHAASVLFYFYAAIGYPYDNFGFNFRPKWLYWTQFGITMFIVLDSLLRIFGHGRRVLGFSHDIINLLLGTEMLLTLIPSLHNLWVPTFLFVWSIRPIGVGLFRARRIAEASHHDATTEWYIAVFNAALIVSCLLVTSICGLQHIEQMDMFDAWWLVMVTFSTVGYGDLFPHTRQGRLWVMFLIITSIVLLPKLISDLLATWQQKHQFNLYTSSSPHVVVSFGVLDHTILEDFLTEFFESDGGPKGDRKYRNVVVLAPDQLTPAQNAVLMLPLWYRRVCYVRGSSVLPRDLERAKISSCEACFVLGEQPDSENSAADIDARTILRAWAINDYAPRVEVYTQLALITNRRHVKRIPGLVACADETRCALLALGCQYRGANTLITTLVHTSSRKQDMNQSFDNQVAALEQSLPVPKLRNPEEIRVGKVIEALKLQALCSKADIFSVELEKTTPLLSKYIGQNFSLAARNLLQDESRICLIAVTTHTKNCKQCQPEKIDGSTAPSSCHHCHKGKIPVTTLFPGELCILQENDLLFYIADLPLHRLNLKNPGSDLVNNSNQEGSVLPFKRKSSIGVPHLRISKEMHSKEDDMLESDIVSRPVDDREDHLATHCFQRKTPLSPAQYGQLDLLSPEKPDLSKLPPANVVCVNEDHSGDVDDSAYLLLQHLRANRDVDQIVAKTSPVVFIYDSNKTPSTKFLGHLAKFPHAYYCRGTLYNLPDDVKKNVIDNANRVLVLRDPMSKSADDKYLSDSRVVLTVNAVKHSIKETKILAELVHRSNMRFIWYDVFKSRLEKLSLHFHAGEFLHRPAYSSGMVFANSMLDTALYQSFAEDKQGLMDVIQQLVGVGISESSAALTQVVVDSKLLSRSRSICGGDTYGNICELLLFYGLSGNEAYRGIPIGIHTTKDFSSKEATDAKPPTAAAPTDTPVGKTYGRSRHIVGRREKKSKHPDTLLEYGDKMSLVLPNPEQSMRLTEGDVIYVLKRPGTAVVEQLVDLDGRSSPTPNLALSRITEPMGSDIIAMEDDSVASSQV